MCVCVCVCVCGFSLHSFDLLGISTNSRRHWVTTSFLEEGKGKQCSECIYLSSVNGDDINNVYNTGGHFEKAMEKHTLN